MLTSELWIVWVGAKVATNTIRMGMGKGAVLTLLSWDRQNVAKFRETKKQLTVK